MEVGYDQSPLFGEVNPEAWRADGGVAVTSQRRSTRGARLAVSDRTRIKQLFRANDAPILYWFPLSGDLTKSCEV